MGIISHGILQPVSSWVGVPTAIEKTTSWCHALGNLFALADKATTRGVDKRLIAAAAIGTAAYYYGGNVPGLTDAAAGAADQSGKMLLDFAASMRNTPTFV